MRQSCRPPFDHRGACFGPVSTIDHASNSSAWTTDHWPALLVDDHQHHHRSSRHYCTIQKRMKRRTKSMVKNAATTSTSNHPVARVTRFLTRENSSSVRIHVNASSFSSESNNSSNLVVDDDDHKDAWSYAILIALYTLQGIPMGLSASIPFLIQQKIKLATTAAAAAAAAEATTAGGSLAAAATAAPAVAASARAAARLSYKANAIFALCSWPFSLKLLWAPLVDACFLKGFGRRKSWLVPVQALAGLLMVSGANFVERQLGLGVGHTIGESINVKGVTAFFFALYFLMATQDIAVDGWALTMLSKKNRGRGPVCNSIGQNIGYFMSFVGFLALNDAESSEALWRPLLGLKSDPDNGLVSLGSFIRFMGYFMLVTTTLVALFKHEVTSSSPVPPLERNPKKKMDDDDEDKELDASEIGLKETYHRLWAVCKLPSVRWLFLVLLTYRLPTSLGDNVKFLKAVEFGLSKSTTALLSPTVILPLGILVPIIATRIWHNTPLQQFMTAYKLRVTLVPIFDVLMLLALKGGKPGTVSGLAGFWGIIILSTACSAIVNSMQFNAQMSFFAKRVDPAIGGSYMTLLNTAANLGGTWPASFVMWLVGRLSTEPKCTTDPTTGVESCIAGRDPFFVLQATFSILGCLWIVLMGKRVRILQALPEDAWRTHILDEDRTVYDEESLLSSVDVELGGVKDDDSTKRK